MTRYLLGPELFWCILYSAAMWLGKANNPPTKGMDQFIETLWFWIPFAGLLVFGLWWMPLFGAPNLPLAKGVNGFIW